uniref:Uncharacterized protein n=1 Tax=Tetranychus urticae TaxID=32264 RepID=T1KX87_TETUR
MAYIKPTIMHQLWRVADIVSRNVNCESELRVCEDFFHRITRIITDYHEHNEIDIDTIGLDYDQVSLVCNSVLGPSQHPPPPNPQENEMNRLIQLMDRLIVSTDRHNEIDDRLYEDVGKVFEHMIDRFDGLIEFFGIST